MKNLEQAACSMAAIYARTASAKNGSADRLAEQIRKVKSGLPPDLASKNVEVYAEIGSGTLGFEKDRDDNVRPELQRLANDVRRGRVGSVHVADRRKLAHSLGVLWRFTKLCGDHGVTVFAGDREVGCLAGLSENAHLASMAEAVADLCDEFHHRACLLRRR